MRDSTGVRLAAAGRTVRCTQPARFTATWWTSRDPMGDDGLCHPTFDVDLISTEGRGLPFDRWASLRLAR